jgi:hypothetical protein
MNYNHQMYNSIEYISQVLVVIHLLEFFSMIEQNLLVIVDEYDLEIIVLILQGAIHVQDPLLHLLPKQLNHYLNNHWFHLKKDS